MTETCLCGSGRLAPCRLALGRGCRWIATCRFCHAASCVASCVSPDKLAKSVLSPRIANCRDGFWLQILVEPGAAKATWLNEMTSADARTWLANTTARVSIQGVTQQAGLQALLLDECNRGRLFVKVPASSTGCRCRRSARREDYYVPSHAYDSPREAREVDVRVTVFWRGVPVITLEKELALVFVCEGSACRGAPKGSGREAPEVPPIAPDEASGGPVVTPIFFQDVGSCAGGKEVDLVVSRPSTYINGIVLRSEADPTGYEIHENPLDQPYRWSSALNQGRMAVRMRRHKACEGAGCQGGAYEARVRLFGQKDVSLRYTYDDQLHRRASEILEQCRGSSERRKEQLRATKAVFYIGRVFQLGAPDGRSQEQLLDDFAASLALGRADERSMYKVTCQLGVGGFGCVVRVVDTRGRVYAAKVAPPCEADSLCSEYFVITRLMALAREKGLPISVPSVYDFATVRIPSQDGDAEYALMLMEEFSGNLRRKAYDLENLALSAILIAMTLHSLHYIGSLHADVKSGNLLEREDSSTGSCWPVLADFGGSCRLGQWPWEEKPLGPNDMLPLHQYTTEYLDPSLGAGATYASTRSDVYSFAVAFMGMIPKHLKVSSESAALPGRAKTAFQVLMERLMADDPRDRPESFFEVALQLRDQCAPPGCTAAQWKARIAQYLRDVATFAGAGRDLAAPSDAYRAMLCYLKRGRCHRAKLMDVSFMLAGALLKEGRVQEATRALHECLELAPRGAAWAEKRQLAEAKLQEAICHSVAGEAAGKTEGERCGALCMTCVPSALAESIGSYLTNHMLVEASVGRICEHLAAFVRQSKVRSLAGVCSDFGKQRVYLGTLDDVTVAMTLLPLRLESLAFDAVLEVAKQDAKQDARALPLLLLVMRRPEQSSPHLRVGRYTANACEVRCGALCHRRGDFIRVKQGACADGGNVFDDFYDAEGWRRAVCADHILDAYHLKIATHEVVAGEVGEPVREITMRDRLRALKEAESAAIFSENGDEKEDEGGLLVVKIVALAKSLMAKDMLVVTSTNNTVRSVRRAVNQKLGVPANHLVLISRGKQMKDEAKLTDFKAMPNGELALHLLYRPPAAPAVDHDVRVTDAAVGADETSPLVVKVIALAKFVMAEDLFVIAGVDSTALTVKQAVQLKLSICTEHVVLLCRGRSMQDDARLSEYRVSAEGVLTVYLLYRPPKPASRDAHTLDAVVSAPVAQGTSAVSLASHWKVFTA